METNEEVNIIFSRLIDVDTGIQRVALNALIDRVRSTSAQDIYSEVSKLEGIYDKLSGENKRFLSDILSVLFAYTDGPRSLTYRVTGSIIPIESWDYQYVKQLLCHIVKFGNDSVLNVAEECISFLFAHNLECDGIDFLDELKIQETVINFIDEHNYDRAVLYLNEMSKYNDIYKNIVYKIHLKMKNYAAVLVSILNMENGMELMVELLDGVDSVYRTQLVLMLARTGKYLPLSDRYADIICNRHLNAFFKILVNNLEIENPKGVAEFLKGSPTLRQEREISMRCLAPMCVSNAFVHFGFGRDTVFCPEAGDSQIEINFEALGSSAKAETIAIFASIAVINIFSLEGTMARLNDLVYAENRFRRTGAILGLALTSSKVYDENGVASALLLENLIVNCNYQRIASLFGLQAIYTGTQNTVIFDLIREHLSSGSPEVACFTSFVLGSVFAGSGNIEIATLLLEPIANLSIETANTKEATVSFNNFAILGIALIFFKNKNYGDILNIIKAMDSPFYNHVYVLVKCFAHIDSGDTDLLNEIFSIAFEDEDKNDGVAGDRNLLQSIAMFGMCVVSMGDELRTQLAIRMLNSSTILDNMSVKSTAPLCMALLSPSNPSVDLVDTIAKYCNVTDQKIIANSVIALGVIGAGTNNSHISDILEDQYLYSSKYLRVSSSIKMAQGLLHLGKGTMTLSPFLFEKKYLNVRNFIGLFTPLFSLIDPETSPLNSKYCFLNFLYVQASSLKFVMTIDSNLNPIPTTLRIGQPVNVVGIVGKPKKIASVQTHESPVIVQTNEVVEINDSNVKKVFTNFIEDLVIVNEEESGKCENKGQ